MSSAPATGRRDRRRFRSKQCSCGSALPVGGAAFIRRYANVPLFTMVRTRMKAVLKIFVVSLMLSAVSVHIQAQMPETKPRERIDCAKIFQCAPVSKGCQEVSESNWFPGTQTYSDGQPLYCKTVTCTGNVVFSRDWSEVKKKFEEDPFHGPGPFSLYRIGLYAGLKLKPWNGGFMGHINYGFAFYDPDLGNGLPVARWDGVIDISPAVQGPRSDSPQVKK
jgi:hypothetical protein